MHTRPSRFFAALGCFALIVLVVRLTLDRPPENSPASLPAAHTAATPPARPAPGPAGIGWGASALADRLIDRLRQQLENRDARPREAVLTFKDEDAYRRFLARAGRDGLSVLGTIDDFLTARVRYDSLDALQRELMNHTADYLDVDANAYVYTPAPPPVQSRSTGVQLPFGDRMLAFLGVEGDHRAWGRGITIAVLDSGVAPDATFDQNRLRHLDIGYGETGSESDGHGTAVAALAAGAALDAIGVAPSASILSIRVTDESGVSDSFTLSRAILAAIENGAHIINISLGAYSSSAVLSNALQKANAAGVVVVASAGNDQAARLTWPAADPGVVSVGAIDALEQQVRFSNSGDNLQLSAPGYGVQTAWVDGQRVTFSGTSASSPIVAGAIAAVMSESPGLAAIEAAGLILQHSSDAGAPGADPHYGQGILNLGWTMARNDPTRTDTAIASHHYNAATGQMEIVVQNRSTLAVAGLELTIESAAGLSRHTLPWMPPGSVSVVTTPVNQAALAAGLSQTFISHLAHPTGTTDANPANNQRSTTLQTPAP